MKRFFSIAVSALIFLCLLLGGCSDPDSSGSENTAAPAPSSSTEGQSVAGSQGAVDVDLTKLSSTMVYSEIYNMMTTPSRYLGRRIRMRGQYNAQFYQQTEKYYHYVVIADATACCQQGLEFIWSGEHKYPDDYPLQQSEIEIVGVFSSYEELGQKFYYLQIDNIHVIQ